MIHELLAVYAHTAWAGWMKYMFSKSQLNPDGSVRIPAEFVQRWTRQMNTSYKELPESEKLSDRDEADKIMKVVTENRWFVKESK